jgi:hypothetical protein
MRRPSLESSKFLVVKAGNPGAFRQVLISTRHLSHGPDICSYTLFRTLASHSGIASGEDNKDSYFLSLMNLSGYAFMPLRQTFLRGC